MKFLKNSKPVLTAMVQEKTPDGAIDVILNSLYDGADAFGIQLESLEREYRTPETLKKIFDACAGRPIYITSYRNAQSKGMTDDECAELLIEGLEAGADLADVPGDYFCPVSYQLTSDERAIEKQMKLIEKIHSMGKEVLMSSHLNAFFPKDEVVKFAKEQIRRGADISKIVSMANTREQLIEDILIAEELKNTLGAPFLLLAGGKYCRLLRQIGPAFGVCMYLCVQQYKHGNTKTQPILRAAKAIRDNMCLFTED
ncbi:MAG: type I 3-dehydroquinate dehydratase [Clostridia bacterium]|nr:type I 3-dehydroquinate dehydratase [Clostridia bacterium]